MYSLQSWELRESKYGEGTLYWVETGVVGRNKSLAYQTVKKPSSKFITLVFIVCFSHFDVIGWFLVMKLFSDVRKTTRDIYEEMFEKEVEQQEGLDFSLPEDGYLYEQPEFIAGIMHHMHCFCICFSPTLRHPLRPSLPGGAESQEDTALTATASKAQDELLKGLAFPEMEEVQKNVPQHTPKVIACLQKRIKKMQDCVKTFETLYVHETTSKK